MRLFSASSPRSSAYKTLRAALVFPLLAIASCQTAAPLRDTALPAEPPAGEPAAAAADAAHFVIDSRLSEVRLLVFRDGPLARFGHNHVIVGRPQGEVLAAQQAAASAFRLEIPLDSMVVDPPGARAEEGEEFAAEVSEQARQGTHENMLGEQGLDSARHPLIRIVSVAASGPRWNPTVTARITLRGEVRDLRFPAALVQNGDALEVIAGFRLRQSDFGLKPFAALGGGLLVRDALEVRIRVVARRSA